MTIAGFLRTAALLTLLPAAMWAAPASRSFDYPREAVWKAMLQSLTDANIHPESAEASTCSVFFKTESAWSATWGGANDAVALMTTKAVRNASSWQGFVVSGTLSCNALTESKTEVRATFTFAGYNSWMGNWQALSSSGYLERSLFERVDRSLRQMNLGLMPGDPQIVSRAEPVLTGLRRVDAAFKIGAERSAIGQTLIDAQARLDEFANSEASVPLLKFRESCASGLESFRRAWAAGGDSTHLLTAARSSVSQAADYLRSYSSIARESPAVTSGQIVEKTIRLAQGRTYAVVRVVPRKYIRITFVVDGRPEVSDFYTIENGASISVEKFIVIRCDSLKDVEIFAEGVEFDPAGLDGSMLRIVVENRGQN